jgi:hypothetical protein
MILVSSGCPEGTEKRDIRITQIKIEGRVVTRTLEQRLTQALLTQGVHMSGRLTSLNQDATRNGIIVQ